MPVSYATPKVALLCQPASRHAMCITLLRFNPLARLVWLVCSARSVLMALLFPAAMLAAPAVVYAAGNDIVVGQIFDQSPAWIEAGRDYAAGAKTYFDLINSEGGVSGKRIVYLTKDAKGTAADVKRAAEELTGEGKVDVLFGPVGDATMRALLDLKDAQTQSVAIFGPLSGIAPARASVLTLRASYEEEASELLRHFSGLGLTSICLVFTRDEEQQAAVRAVREAIRQLNRTLTCEVPVDDTQGGAKNAAGAVQAKQPQAVIVLGDTAVLGNFAREFPFKKLGVLIGGLSLVNHTALMEIAGPLAAKGIVLTQVVPSPQREGVPIVREFVRALKKFRDEPPSHLALEGFIAGKALIESLRAGLVGKPVRREDVQAILSRARKDTAPSLATTDTGMMNTKGGKPVDVTMVRGDGTLIR